jgi:hypothetical protein
MQFHGKQFDRWRITFWVIVVLAAVASGAHALLG